MALQDAFSNKVDLDIDEKARMVVVKRKDFAINPTGGKVAILTAEPPTFL